MSLSINGLGSALPDPIGAKRDEAAEPPRASIHEEAARGAAADAFVRTSEGPTADGVAPELWALLSTDERAWYLRGAIRGPATYDPASAVGPGSTELPGRLGARLDVRA